MHIDLFKTNGSSPPSKTQLSDMFLVHRFERLAIFPVLGGNPHYLLHEPRFRTSRTNGCRTAECQRNTYPIFSHLAE